MSVEIDHGFGSLVMNRSLKSCVILSLLQEALFSFHQCHASLIENETQLLEKAPSLLMNRRFEESVGNLT